MDGADLFVARDAATWTDDDGTPRMVRLGTVVRSGHPRMRLRPGLFEPLVIEMAFALVLAFARERRPAAERQANASASSATRASCGWLACRSACTWARTTASRAEPVRWTARDAWSTAAQASSTSPAWACANAR